MRYLFRTISMALKALTRNPMRTILTTLGVIMGVAAVIAIREIGQGASQSMQDTIASMGSNILLVLPGASTPRRRQHRRRRRRHADAPTTPSP